MNKRIMLFIVSYVLTIAACDSAPREIRSQIGDPQERESYKSFLDSQGQSFRELPDGTIVIVPDSPEEAKLIEEAIEQWHIERANQFNRSQE